MVSNATKLKFLYPLVRLRSDPHLVTCLVFSNPPMSNGGLEKRGSPSTRLCRDRIPYSREKVKVQAYKRSSFSCAV